MPRRKRLFLALAVFAAILLAIVVVLLNRRVSLSAAAADGRRVSIEKITHGTEHSLTLGKLWVRVLKPVLGTRWAAQRGCVEIRFTNAQPALMVWTRWSGVSLTNQLPLEATILDEYGTESELVLCRWNQSDWQIHTNRFDSTSYVGWIFRNYPRRSRSLRMRIYDRNRRQEKYQAVEITFANPAPTRYPQWTGERLPMTRTNPPVQFLPAITWTNGGTEFTLKAVEPPKQAHFQIQTDGQPDPSWQVGGITILDATGNSVTKRIMLAPGPDRNRVFPLSGALWPGEQAWRFAVEFCRGVDFEEDELWTPPLLDLQPANAAASGAITNSNFNDSTVRVMHPQWRPRSMPWPGRKGQSAEVGVWLSTGSAPHRLFLVHAVDDRNREVQIEPFGSFTMNGWHTFEFLVPSGAQSVRCTFAVRKSVTIDFDVAAESVIPKSSTAP